MLEYQVPTLTAILQLVQDSATRPSSILFFPVFDDFEAPKGSPGFDDFGRPVVNRTDVVGSISIVFSWDTLLQRILPNYIKGMICVLQSSIGQVYSYSVSGNDGKSLIVLLISSIRSNTHNTLRSSDIPWRRG